MTGQAQKLSDNWCRVHAVCLSGLQLPFALFKKAESLPKTDCALFSKTALLQTIHQRTAHPVRIPAQMISLRFSLKIDWTVYILQSSSALFVDIQSTRGRNGNYTLMKDVLGAIVLLYSPLSATSLARLLLISAEKVYRTLDELHSILDVPQCPTYHVRLHHPSFRDFLLNNDRCRDKNLCVDERQAHTALADKYIQLLSSLLKQDIYGVGDFGARAAKVERKQLENCIPPKMRYTCLYCTNHLAKSSVLLRDNNKVHEFLKQHCLHWLKALSWMSKVSEGIYAISSLESIAPVSTLHNILTLLLRTCRLVTALIFTHSSTT